MKTKIIYVLVSSEKDIYLEQAWVSLFSLRHFNKNVDVVLLCDDKTAFRVNEQAPEEFKELAGEIVSVPFAEAITNRERSRWLKTNLRNLVKGDFLFIDTDTIITDSLAEVDFFDYNLAMEYAWHCKLVDRPDTQSIRNRVKGLFGIELKEDTGYFNSGVIYCKDTEECHRFFNKWHENWMLAKDKPMGIQDQQSLVVTVNEMGGVSLLPGNYNCQPVYSMKYIATAKIVHFFNLKWDNHEWSPFCTDNFFLDIKNKCRISDDSKQLILNCRSTFIAPALCIYGDDINIYRSSAFSLLRNLFKRHKFLYKVINKFSRRCVKVKPNVF